MAFQKQKKESKENIRWCLAKKEKINYSLLAY